MESIGGRECSWRALGEGNARGFWEVLLSLGLTASPPSGLDLFHCPWSHPSGPQLPSTLPVWAS